MGEVTRECVSAEYRLHRCTEEEREIKGERERTRERQRERESESV